MAGSRQRSLPRGTRILVAWLAVVSSGLLLVAPGARVAAVPQTQAAEVGPVTVITPTRVLDTRPSEPPAIQTVGFDAATGNPITPGPIQGGTTRRFRIAGKQFPQGTGT